MADGVRVRILGLDRRRAAEVAQLLLGELAFGVVVHEAHAASTVWRPTGATSVVEWIDDQAHVAWTWPRLAPLLDGAVVTREHPELLTPIPDELRLRRLDVEVREVMRPAVIRFDASLPIAEVRRAMDRARAVTAPVLDSSGRLAGVVSAAALAARTAHPGDTAADAMDTTLLTATPDARLRDVVAAMLGRALDEVAVVEERRPIGMVGLDDALGLLHQGGAEMADGLGDGERRPADTPARLRALVPGL